MRNHILGFSDDHGKSPCVLLFGTEHGVTNNLAEFARIRSGDWPDGIVRVEMHGDDRGLESIAINTNPKPPKKTMKYKSTLSALVALIGLALATSAFAQTEPVYYVQTLFSWESLRGISNNTGMNVSSVTNYYATNSSGINVADVRKQLKLPLSIQFNSNSNIAGTNSVVFVKSIDGTYYDTNDVTVLSAKWTPAAAGGQIIIVTNIDTSDCGYVKLLWLTNDTVGAGGVIMATNIVVKGAIKIP